MSHIPETLEFGIPSASLKVPSSLKHPRWLTVAGAIVLFGGGCAAHNEHGPGSPRAAVGEIGAHVVQEQIGEGVDDFEATGSEWRTPPLWGLGLVSSINDELFLLHDGRARGFEEAILWHGGQGKRAGEAFRTTPKKDREALVAFLSSL